MLALRPTVLFGNHASPFDHDEAHEKIESWTFWGARNAWRSFFRVVDIQWTRICKVEELRRLDQSVRNTALC